MKNHVKLSNKSADLLLNNVRQIVFIGLKADIELCRILHESHYGVTKNGEAWQFVWEYWGYKSWFDFVEIEVGLHEMTANLYKKVWQVFGVELSGSWGMEEALPITKMKILASSDKLTKQNVKSWLKKAKGMSCCDLQAELYGENAMRTFSVTVSHAEHKMISKVLENARKQLGDDDKTNGELLVDILRLQLPLRKVG